MTDEYPSWREALFSDDKIANIRCAIKYVFWHGAYLLLALLGVLLVAGAKVLDALSRSGGNRAVGGVKRGLGDSRVKKAARYVFGTLMVVYVAGVIAYGVYLFITILLANPATTIFWTVAIVGGSIALLLGWAYGGPRIKSALRRAGGATASAASKAGTKAAETPGIRRVYGNCPVHMDISPRWFDKIFDQ